METSGFIWPLVSVAFGHKNPWGLWIWCELKKKKQLNSVPSGLYLEKLDEEIAISKIKENVNTISFEEWRKEKIKLLGSSKLWLPV